MAKWEELLPLETFLLSQDEIYDLSISISQTEVDKQVLLARKDFLKATTLAVHTGIAKRIQGGQNGLNEQHDYIEAVAGALKEAFAISNPQSLQNFLNDTINTIVENANENIYDASSSVWQTYVKNYKPRS